MDNNNKLSTNVDFSKHIQIYELANKVQNILNTESLLPQFIYFAKNVEEMRKKWQQAELRCKELENKLNLEKSIYQRKINELKIDIETHHEKRLQAEKEAERLQYELEKLQKQFEMVKEVLCSDKRSINPYNYDDRFTIISAYEMNTHQNRPYTTHQSNLNLNNGNNKNYDAYNDHEALDKCGIEDTGSIISDYTEDDIDLAMDDNNADEQNIINKNIFTPQHYQQQQQQSENIIKQSGSTTNAQNNNNNLPPQPIHQSSASLQNIIPQQQQQQQQHQTRRDQERQSLSRKRNQRHQSSSLTRANAQSGNSEKKEKKKRSRTRSIDLALNRSPTNNNKNSNNRRSSNGTTAITAITTLKLDEDGRPLTVTSEITHNTDLDYKRNAGDNENKIEMEFMPTQQQRAMKNRKKRPSREFLQRSVDDSENLDDSEIFWKSSDSVIDEVISNQPIKAHNLNIMTPIQELATPQPLRTLNNHDQLYSVYKKQQTTKNATPSHHQKMTPFNANSKPVALLPFAKKYKKAHTFKGQVILNSELCAHCDKRTKFGKMIMKCKECEMVVHSECKDLLQRACFSTACFPQQGTIADYVNQEDYPRVPPILQMVIYEIENRGLLSHEVGLYRVNGSDTQIKQLKDRLIKRHQQPDLRKIVDVHVLCSFVKDFLNNLSEHLITYELWQKFAQICDIQNEMDRIRALEEAIIDLPEANRDTLAYVILHLQRIAETPECKMPASNLARVFGPSIVGNSSANLQPVEIINELKIQHQIVENLIKIPSSFYLSFIESGEQQQRLFKNSTKTPDMRKSKTAVVLSSMLGPAANIPPSLSIQQQYPINIQPNQQQMKLK